MAKWIRAKLVLELLAKGITGRYAPDTDGRREHEGEDEEEAGGPGGRR